MKQILKVLVGSQAHGLSNEDSDFDYRGVFVVPTNDILSLGGHKTNTNWIQGQVDDTSWELSHFLMLATKSNPSILETFLAPVEEMTPEGKELRELFQYVWSSQGVRDAFLGYGHNQRKKFLEGKDERPDKYACAYARVLYNAYELLTTGTFTTNMMETPVGEVCKRFKYGFYESIGEVIDHCKTWEDKVEKAFKEYPKKETDIDKVNEFLIKVRKNN